MTLCGKHRAEYTSWQTTTVDFGPRYNADRAIYVVNQAAAEIKQLHIDNRRELIRKQLKLIAESCRAGRCCGEKDEAFT